jgi:putative transposase
MLQKKYPIKTLCFSKLTDFQWQLIKKLLENQEKRGRKREKDMRLVVNGILKVVRTGCQWRNTDESYGPWQSLYYYFRKWKLDGTWSRVLSQLVESERVRVGRSAKASAGAIDSQSVKKGAFISEDCGIDGNKKINGRKRTIFVDTLGLPLAIHVGAANEHDGQAGINILAQIQQSSDKMQLIRADAGYKGEFKEAAFWYNYEVEIAQKPESQKGFIPQAGRWQVERSFSWFNFFRRLDKDHEKTTASAVTFIQLAFISIILARI